MRRDAFRKAAVSGKPGIAAAIVIALFAVLGLKNEQILTVSGLGRAIRVVNGDIITLRYTQSMYHVPVVEKFRVRNGNLCLFEIASSGAALEYLGIERHGEGNAERDLKGFSVPRASIGNHVLTVKEREIPFSDLNEPGPSIWVRIDVKPHLHYLLGNIL